MDYEDDIFLTVIQIEDICKWFNIEPNKLIKLTETEDYDE